MKRISAWVVALAILLISSTAFGHAEEPAAEKLFFFGEDLFVKANFGMSSTTFEGMVCEEAFVGGSSWKLSVLGENEWVVLGETNIQRTTDGCEFEPVKSTTGLIIPNFVTSPGRVNLAYIANAGDGEGIWISTDRGATFQQANLDTTSLQLTAARFSDDDTLYVSGYDPDQMGIGRIWEVDLATLEPTSLPLPADVKFPYVLDANANGIVWLGRLEVQTIFWGGFGDIAERTYEPASWPSGAVLSEDAQTLWISGPEAGLGIARGQANGTWDLLIPQQVTSCIERDGDEIYFCGLERRDGADVFRLTGDDSFDPVVQFTDLRGSRADCPDATDVGTVCPIVWNEIAPYFGQEPDNPDMGGSMSDTGTESDTGNANNDAGSESDAGSTPPTNNGDCCSTIPRPSSPWLFVAFLFLAVYRRRT